jgi:hypothetical protein
MKLAHIKNKVAGVLLLSAAIAACKPDGNPNKLPSVNPADYNGKIDGFSSSDEVLPESLIAYWSFDDTKNELKTATAPGSSAGDSYVADAVRGKSLSLTAGYVYFPTQFQKFKTDTLKSWSISTWIKIKNNGSKRTMLFQLARPGIFTGNINFALNTNGYPATNDSILRIQPTFMTIGGGTQDNVNNGTGMDKVTPNSWVHLILTYEYTTGVFNIWMNAVKVGGFPNRGTGNNNFKSYEPSEVIIGSNYNGIPGKSVSTDVTFAPMTGQVDELRIFNRSLPDAFIRALYNLGKANK